MLEMAGRRHHADQPLRRRQPLVRLRRCLDRVDVVMVGAGVLRVFGKHRQGNCREDAP